jgi:hypothetical protein
MNLKTLFYIVLGNNILFIIFNFNFFMFKFLFKCLPSKIFFLQFQNINKISMQAKYFSQSLSTENDNSEMELRTIQLSPKYEAAISSFISGETHKAINFLEDLKNDLKSDKNDSTEDFIFLLKKLISFTKHDKNAESTIKHLNNLHETGIKIYRNDFTKLFDNIEYIIIQLIHISPSKSIEYANMIVDNEILPKFFDNIIYYYLATAYGIEGKPNSLEKGITLFEKIIDQLEDNYINGCVLNNYACLLWWSRLSKHIENMQKKGHSIELLKSIAKDSYDIVKVFKTALAQIENINVKFEEETILEDNPRNKILSSFLNRQFDITEKYDKQIINYMVKMLIILE